MQSPVESIAAQPKRKLGRVLKLLLLGTFGCMVLACAGIAAYALSAPYRLAGQADTVITEVRGLQARGKYEFAALSLREYIRALPDDARSPEIRQLLIENYEKWIASIQQPGDAAGWKMLADDMQTSAGPRYGLAEWATPRLITVQVNQTAALMREGRNADARDVYQKIETQLGPEQRAQLASAASAAFEAALSRAKTQRADIAPMVREMQAALHMLAGLASDSPALKVWDHIRNMDAKAGVMIHYLSKRAGPLRAQPKERLVSSITLANNRSPAKQMDKGPLPPGLSLTTRTPDADYSTRNNEDTYDSMRADYTLEAAPTLANGIYNVKLSGYLARDSATIALGLGARANFDFVVWVDD